MEFIVPFGSHDFYFIEMNTRLQVEHPVTELCTALDLVTEQIAIASGNGFSPRIEAAIKGGGIERRGHAIEARIIAEDPEKNFIPSCGRMDVVQFPSGPGVRVDSWAEAGLTVSPHYDSLLGKVIAYGHDRAEALSRLELALRETTIHPIRTTAGFLRRVIGSEPFRTGAYDTGLLSQLKLGAIEIPREITALLAAEESTNAPGTRSTQYERRLLSDWARG